MNSEIIELLDQLKIAREHAAGVRAEKKAMIEEVQASAAFRALDEATNEADATITELENDIRDMAITLHRADRELPDRVSVKMFSVVTIPDYSAARLWALHNFTPALTLDTKTFEKAAKDGGIPADLATVTKEARAQIATKL